MYWIKLSLILLDSQLSRNSLAFQTNILGHGSQMQLRLSDIYKFSMENFFSVRTTGFGLDYYTCQKHFTTFQILQCRQLYIHLILHIKCVAGCHRFILSPFFVFPGVLLNIVDTVATQKICQGHLKLRKQRLHPIHF